MEYLNPPLQANDSVAVLGGVDAAVSALLDSNQAVAHDVCGCQPGVTLDGTTLFQVDVDELLSKPLSRFDVVGEGFGVEVLAEGFNAGGNEVLWRHCGLNGSGLAVCSPAEPWEC